MRTKGWLGLAVVMLVGCGGEVVVPDPDPIRKIIVDPIDEHREDQKRKVVTRGAGGLDDAAGMRRTVRIDTPAPTPTPTPAPTPTPKPVEPPSAPPPTHACTTILVGDDVRLGTITFGPTNRWSDDGAVLDLSMDAAQTITSLGRQGDSLFACSLGKAIKISVAEGTVESSEIACDAVTAGDTAIWIQSSARAALERYTDWTAVFEGRVDASFEPMPAIQIGVTGNKLIGMGLDANGFMQLVRFDAETNEPASSSPWGIRVPSWRGVDMTADGFVYFTAGTKTIMIYDPVRNRNTLAGSMSSATTGFYGLACDD